MTSHIESPTSTGSSFGARTWYRQVRSALGRPRPRFTLMPDAQVVTTINHPSQSIASLIGTIPTLRFATPARLSALAERARREAVAAGEVLIRQGEDGDDVFFVVDGTFEVLISHFGQTPDFVGELGAGDCFGELGVLYSVRRTATVRCTVAGHILRMPGETFLDTLETGS